ncbi:MAG: hypothetical protein K0R61_1693 [Microvirga sp.]|jgi:hypothetical protein|nr:hypothetical protein [Microvirga sp.]
MGARILRRVRQRRERRRFVLFGIVVDRLFIRRNGRTAEEPGPSPSRTGSSGKHRPRQQRDRQCGYGPPRRTSRR